MTDKQKLEKILNLLTDKNVGILDKKGQLTTDEERFGALVFAGYAFKKAYKIANTK